MLNKMDKLKEFLNLKELGEYLTGQYAEAFSEVFGFISFVSIILFVIWSLQWVPPFRNFIRAIRQDIESEFTESYLIREMIPNETMRHRFYRILMWGLVFSMLAGYFASFYYASAALAAMLAKNLTVNRYTALVILGSLSAILFMCSVYYMKEANKLARFLNENRA